jgi:hypothetical protein
MAHWEHRSEKNWARFVWKQPYAKGLERLKNEVLAKTDFDPATLWQWGTMQAMALIEVLRATESAFGADGQKVVFDALRRVGHDVGRQILDGATVPDDLTDTEFASFFATVVNRVAYASLEVPKIDSDEQASFDILWCPHQDHYGAFDCRVQRYFVQGMIEAANEFARNRFGFEVRFDSTIPSGAETCHFTMWKSGAAEAAEWARYTTQLERKALQLAKK